MTRPGTQIRERTAPLARSADIDTGKTFFIGYFEKGPNDGVEDCRNLDDVKRKFGNAVAWSSSLTWLDVAFRHGLSRAKIVRLTGPNPIKATDLSTDGIVRATATSHGAYANGWDVVITRVGGNITGATVRDQNDVTIESIAGSWAATFDFVTAANAKFKEVVLSIAAGGVVAADTLTLAAGTDDHASAGATQVQAALDLFSRDLGPGQVVVTDVSSANYWQLSLNHGKDYNRVALLDEVDGQDYATVSAIDLDTLLTNGRYGAFFYPWVEVPGDVIGSPRRVQPSAMVAGLISWNDGHGVSPNQPTAGDFGISNYADDVLLDLSDAQREALNNLGINVIINKYGTPRVYGFRSAAPKDTNPDWWQFANSRLYMAIAAQADAIMEHYVHRMIDGKRLVLKQLEGDLTAMLLPFWESGALYGETPSEAFFVDASSEQANTDENIADGEIRSIIELVMSSEGELITLDIIKKRIGNN